MLLNKYEGCTKCQNFYSGHQSQPCPNGFPLVKGYKTVPLTDVLPAKKAKAVAKSIAKAVAATMEAVNSDVEVLTTAASLLDSPGKYESDSSEDWNILSDHNVSASLHAKHFI